MPIYLPPSLNFGAMLQESAALDRDAFEEPTPLSEGPFSQPNMAYSSKVYAEPTAQDEGCDALTLQDYSWLDLANSIPLPPRKRIKPSAASEADPPSASTPSRSYYKWKEKRDQEVQQLVHWDGW